MTLDSELLLADSCVRGRFGGNAMPFRDYTGFDLETVRVLNEAYDAAFAKLSLDNPNPSTSKLAALIVKMAREGERDPVKLCDAAVAKLQK